MKHNFDEIEHAFFYVSSGSKFENEAVINRETGQIYYISGFGDTDEVPEDIEDDKYVSIPHKNDMDLGSKLVFRFASEYISEHYDTIKNIFRSKGAYSRYKVFLQDIGRLEQWFKYEDNAMKISILEWCKENNIETNEKLIL